MIALYHVTPHKNITPIMHEGLLPEKSQGKRALVWLVTPDAIPWALAHCSLRHNCKTSDLSILRVNLTEDKITRTRWKFAFVCKDKIFPVSHISAREYAINQHWWDED